MKYVPAQKNEILAENRFKKSGQLFCRTIGDKALAGIARHVTSTAWPTKVSSHDNLTPLTRNAFTALSLIAALWNKG